MFRGRSHKKLMIINKCFRYVLRTFVFALICMEYLTFINFMINDSTYEVKISIRNKNF